MLRFTGFLCLEHATSSPPKDKQQRACIQEVATHIIAATYGHGTKLSLNEGNCWWRRNQNERKIKDDKSKQTTCKFESKEIRRIKRKWSLKIKWPRSWVSMPWGYSRHSSKDGNGRGTEDVKIDTKRRSTLRGEAGSTKKMGQRLWEKDVQECWFVILYCTVRCTLYRVFAVRGTKTIGG